ncbi:3-oxoacyl-ACP synthase [Burkholderia gladioli]|uniref:3-oxoacyl-ACP synthase n=1 Tax=Burkholderia gladioli TaxID=28095 RepID=UPI00068C07B3|nr:3-oxoacyl-ACP synthase [Burkholderia gladioli]KVM58890.1 3-oxoacyl-ACP synthase [Burkholderia gladioli]
MSPPLSFACRRDTFRIGIDAAAYELPGARVEIEAWAAEHGYPAERAAAIARAGSRYFHVASDTSETELAIAAVQRLLDTSRSSAKQIGAIVHVHTQPFSVPPAPRSLPHEVAAHCGIVPLWMGSIAPLASASIATGIEAVRALMRRHAQLDAALVVSSDRAYGEHTRMRQDRGVQCDGAAAMLLVRNSTRNRLGGIALSTSAPAYRDAGAAGYETGFDGAPEAGFESSFESRFESAFESRLASRLGERHHAGFAPHARAPSWPVTREVIDAAVAMEPHPLADYALLLPPNVDLPGWDALCREMRLPRERLFAANIHARGHACCSDFPINLADAGLDALALGQHVIGVMQSSRGAHAALTLHPASRHDD